MLIHTKIKQMQNNVIDKAQYDILLFKTLVMSLWHLMIILEVHTIRHKYVDIFFWNVGNK